MRAIIITILTLSLAISCLAFSKKPKSGPVEFVPVQIGQHSSIDTSAVFLIDDIENWEKIWQLAQGSIEPTPIIPEIDFSKNTVIAIFMGRKNSAGYSVEISQIIKDGKNLNVKAINHISGGGMMLPVLTTPYQIVKIPEGDFNLHVEYTDQKE